MKKLYPFVSSVDNTLLLISVSLSFFCFPILALLVVHSVCKMLFGMSLHNSQVAGTSAFIIVGLYSIVGIIYMYIRYFKTKKKSKR